MPALKPEDRFSGTLAEQAAELNRAGRELIPRKIGGPAAWALQIRQNRG
jgi:hypothetical protein